MTSPHGGSAPATPKTQNQNLPMKEKQKTPALPLVGPGALCRSLR